MGFLLVFGISTRSLMDVDELIRRQTDQEDPPLPTAAVKKLKLLQRACQDIVVLACSRFIIPQSIMKWQGIPPQLLDRLEAVFGQAALQDDCLWSRFKKGDRS